MESLRACAALCSRLACAVEESNLRDLRVGEIRRRAVTARGHEDESRERAAGVEPAPQGLEDPDPTVGPCSRPQGRMFVGANARLQAAATVGVEPTYPRIADRDGRLLFLERVAT